MLLQAPTRAGSSLFQSHATCLQVNSELAKVSFPGVRLPSAGLLTTKVTGAELVHMARCLVVPLLAAPQLARAIPLLIGGFACLLVLPNRMLPSLDPCM